MGPSFPTTAHYEIYGDNEILARDEGFKRPSTAPTAEPAAPQPEPDEP
jgi:hypothetical protein